MKKLQSVKNHTKTYHLLSEMRRACHVLWESNDPKAMEAWHILFDAHNDAVLQGGNPTSNDINNIMSVIETKKAVDVPVKKSIMYV